METVKNTQINEKQIHKLINDSNQILLTTHENPDGDGLGSQIAMFNFIKSLNKNCRIINISQIPRKYKFLDKNDVFETFNESQLDWINKTDLVIIFDIGHSKRVGVMSKYIYHNKKSLSIDHHPLKNDEPFSHTWIDINSPATGYMVWKLLRNKIELPFDYQSALGLYTALVTDTGSFRYSNTTSKCHIMAAELIESGINPQQVTTKIYESKNLKQIRLLGDALNEMKFSCKNRVAWIKLNKQNFLKRGAGVNDVEGFTDYIRSIENVEIAFTMFQFEDDHVKLSFRSKGNYIINDVAKIFGGGGHKYAAGAKVYSTSMKKIENKILHYLNRKF